jgi:hypothetical protein
LARYDAASSDAAVDGFTQRTLVRAVVVFLFLYVCRCVILLIGPWYDVSLAGAVWRGLGRSGMDCLAVTGLAAVALLVGNARRIAGDTLLLAGAFVLIAIGAANVFVVAAFRHPVSLRTLQFAGLPDTGPLVTIVSYASWRELVLALLAIAALIAVFVAPKILAGPFAGHIWLRRIVAGSTAILFAGLPLHTLSAENPDEFRRLHANAAWSFFRSLAGSRPPPAGPTRVNEAAVFALYPSDHEALGERLTRQAPLQNVVIIVMESVGSRYLDLQRFPQLTPQLAALRESSAYFPNVYPATPSSAGSLFSILFGRYSPVRPTLPPDRALAQSPDLIS